MAENRSICRKCICSTTVPEVVLNEQGLCSECTTSERARLRYFPAAQYQFTMEKRFARLKHETIPYHAMVMLSGGKDSAYLLSLLTRKYQLRPLAFAVIHPFVNALAIENMEKITQKLHVDLLKFSVDEALVKRYIRHGILYGQDYGLNEFFGCTLCSTLYHLVSLKMAISLNIPYLVDGRSPGESPFPHFISGQNMAAAYLKENPFGGLRQLFHDACGNEYGGSIYDFSFDSFQNARFPAKLSPLSFMTYDYTDIIRELDAQGILKSSEARTGVTNCDVWHFFTYLAYKRYGCHSYIRQISSGIRRDMPTLFDEFMATGSQKLTRDEHLKILGEIREVLCCIAGQVGNPHVAFDLRYRLAPLSMQRLGEEKFSAFVNRLTHILPYYIHYFDI